MNFLIYCSLNILTFSEKVIECLMCLFFVGNTLKVRTYCLVNFSFKSFVSDKVI